MSPRNSARVPASVGPAEWVRDVEGGPGRTAVAEELCIRLGRVRVRFEAYDNATRDSLTGRCRWASSLPSPSSSPALRVLARTPEGLLSDYRCSGLCRAADPGKRVTEERGGRAAGPGALRGLARSRQDR